MHENFVDLEVDVHRDLPRGGGTQTTRRVNRDNSGGNRGYPSNFSGQQRYQQSGAYGAQAGTAGAGGYGGRGGYYQASSSSSSSEQEQGKTGGSGGSGGSGASAPGGSMLHGTTALGKWDMNFSDLKFISKIGGG